MKDQILEAIKKIRETKKGFKQSFDLVINLRNIDLNDPANKIKAEILLPKGSGKDYKIGVFADVLIPKVRETSAILIKKDEIPGLGTDKKKLRQMAKDCYCFLAEASLMPSIGKSLGQVLAVRGKMPKPIPPTIPNMDPLLERYKNTVNIALKKAPVIQCRVGSEEMSDDDIAENIIAIFTAVKAVLPKGKESLRNICIKSTMSKPVKIQIK